MEFGLWSLVFVVIIVVLKSLKHEKHYYVLNEKNLLRCYLEIKKIHPDLRLTYFEEWESRVIKAVADSEKKHFGKVVQLHTFNIFHKR